MRRRLPGEGDPTSVHRRAFVRAGGLALVALGLDPVFLRRAAGATIRVSGTAPGRKTLVCLFQRGGVDGLSMVVPHGDALYYRERPRIAIPRPGAPGGAIDLDGYFGLHPALASLAPLYHDGSLAIIHAVGSPDRTRSHFDAQHYMESGTPGTKSTRDGWLNRVLQTAHAREHRETPFRGVALGPELPRALRGAARAVAIEDPRALRRAEAAHGAMYPSGPLGTSLSYIALLLKADLGVEIACTDVGGWDTHVNQGASEGQLAARLRELGGALAAFSRDLRERMSDVVVLTMSEFGRTVAENRNAGTDHGHATAMFVLGGRVRGGKVYGGWPTLDPATRFEGRDLAVTTDFRDLFAEVLTGHLGTTNLCAVFPAYRQRQGVGVMGGKG